MYKSMSNRSQTWWIGQGAKKKRKKIYMERKRNLKWVDKKKDLHGKETEFGKETTCSSVQAQAIYYDLGKAK